MSIIDLDSTECAVTFCDGKTRMVRLLDGEQIFKMFFNRIYARDGRTDGRTQIASHGKDRKEAALGICFQTPLKTSD